MGHLAGLGIFPLSSVRIEEIKAYRKLASAASVAVSSLTPTVCEFLAI